MSTVVSEDTGNTWTIAPSSGAMSGDWGSGIVAGSDRHIAWNTSTDLPNASGSGFLLRLWADGMSGQLASYWSLDEGTGTLVHDPFGYNGLVQGNANWAAGSTGSALAFDTATYVELPATRALLGSASGTIDAYIKPSSYAINILCSRSVYKDALPGDFTRMGVYLLPVGDGRVYLSMYGLGGVAGPVLDDVFLPSVDPVPLDEWTRVTASWDSNTNEARLWINSALVNSWTDSFGPLSTVAAGAVRIGAQFNDDPDCRFHGVIDEVRLFEGAVSPGGAAADSNVFAIGICGDGSIVGMEGCDDGNINDKDGCSSSCLVEAGSICVGEPSVCTMGIPVASTWSMGAMALLLASIGTALSIRRRYA